MAPAKKKLSTYRRKRDFDRTPEPSGEAATPTENALPRFVIQRHRARRLHYDFRLEIDGVLVSWAVPKGVTLDPRARHLAVHVEDHPLDYADFEGVIPAGEYGGGDVIVWDRGTWELHGAQDARKAVEAGEIHVELHGQKLHGRVVLVRTGEASGGKENWLALHKRDDAAVDGWDPEEHPESVISGLTNDEIAANPERVWTREGEKTVANRVPTFEAATDDELEALDSLGAKGTWTFQGRELALTNLDKVLFPARDKRDDPVTKRELIRYYACVAPTLLPYLDARPLNLHRFPDGVDRKGFWQKQAPKYAPDWIPRWHNVDADPGESELYLVVDSPPALAWLANHAAVELHPWTSRIENVQRPTYALIDLDPGESTTWDELITLARLHRTALEHLGVRGYPKTSGRRGLQVWVPIEPGPSFDETRAWVEQLSRTVAGVVGDLVSGVWEKAARGGRARLDYTQNAINKTLVAPYSVRASAGAPVSMPITWDELDDPDLRSDRWTIRNAADRLSEVGDLMAPMLTDTQQLPTFE
ncbi:MAG: bifunctional non-ous end joining protein LigD [Actinomycetota bacterium]|nr:bifunctional non-ous end joining protein LigD [Actinomycetota bacterium]